MTKVGGRTGTDFSIIRITSKDVAHVESALSLFNSILGDGLFTKSGLQTFADGAESALFGCLVDGKLVGAAQANRIPKSGAEFYTPFGPSAVALIRENVVGNLRNSTVQTGFRRKGYGTALLEARIRWLGEEGCTHAVGITWLHGRVDQSDRVYKVAGFQQVGSAVPEFFRGLNVTFECPFCGSVCRCSAALYSKKL